MSRRPAMMEHLCARLRSARIKNVDSKYFVPDAVLDSIFKDFAVDTCVREIGIPVYHQQESALAIRTGGRKAFAILALLGHETLIVDILSMDGLVKKSEIDNKLPFELSAIRNVLGGDVASQFYEMQWEFIAPFFREDRSHRTLHADTIMPFVGRKRLADGGFGIVFRETMAENHHGLRCGYEADRKVRIVRKELLPEDCSTNENQIYGERFRAEERLLLFLRELRHPNIVRFLASYTLKKPLEVTEAEHVVEGSMDFQYVHNLLFPLADMPLSRLLSNHDNHTLRRHFPSDNDLFQQLWCLSSAIESLHNYFIEEHDLRLIGCHFDLAPRNILIDKGRLLLADFGLSRLRDEKSRSTTPFKVGQGDYIAPECEPVENEMFAKGWCGRPSDIWSFGCMLAEIMTYLRYGANGVETFQHARRHQVVPRWYNSQFHVRGAASDEVRIWLEKLGVQTSNTAKRILLSIEKMMKIDPGQRPRAADVTVDLFATAQQSLWNTINTKFSDLVSDQTTVELCIEWERLLVWGSICIFDTKPFVSDAIEELPVSQYGIEWSASSKEKLFATNDLLKSLDEELNVLSVSTGPDRSLGPTGMPLRELNDRLWLMAPFPVQRRMEILLENRILRMCGAGLEELGDTATTAPKSQKRLGRLIAMKYLIAKINTKGEMGRSTGAHRLLRNKSSVEIADYSLGNHRLGTIHDERGTNRPCIFEWVEYDAHWVDQKNDELYNRVGEIAELFNMGLPDGCQVLRCMGYFHRPEAQLFGLIYPYPDAIIRLLPPVTLEKVIHRLSNRPLLGDIFELAHSLAYTLLTFHKVGWLHKQVSSYNIIFFDVQLPTISARSKPTADDRFEEAKSGQVREYSSTTTERPSLRKKIFSRTSKSVRPNETRTEMAEKSKSRIDQTHISGASKSVIVPESPLRSQKAHEDPSSVSKTTTNPRILDKPYLIGFNHSRPNTPVAFTEGPHVNPGEEDYQHPQYAVHGSRQRFQLGYDYYSVGLVLLEMGLWKPLSDLVEGDIEDYTPLQQQRFWLEKAVPLLGQSMGVIYRDAVALCLSDALLSTPDPLECFEIRVVDQLRTCHA